VVDYEREIPMGPAGADGSRPVEKRKFASVSLQKVPSVGEKLIAEGLASVQNHRDGDERASNFDALCAAEAAAKAAKKNLHSSKVPPPRRLNDLCDPKKAKASGGFLQRSGQVKAIVE
jgi:staphylococcal nuclease domain-containing protein 1